MHAGKSGHQINKSFNWMFAFEITLPNLWMFLIYALFLDDGCLEVNIKWKVNTNQQSHKSTVNICIHDFQTRTPPTLYRSMPYISIINTLLICMYEYAYVRVKLTIELKASALQTLFIRVDITHIYAHVDPSITMR